MKEWGPETLFVIFWIASRACAILLLCFLIIWAARNRQFKNMSLARELPLKYPKVKSNPKPEVRNPNFEIRITP